MSEKEQSGCGTKHGCMPASGGSVQGETVNSYRYFKNDACRYFPCHTKAETDAFNCLFCFCPMNPYEDCLGNPIYIEKADGSRRKDCSGCMFPHIPEHYDRIMEFLKEKT